VHGWLPVGDVGRSALVIGSLFLFTTVDLFLARALLPEAESGAYVAAATIGKTLLALPAAALAAAYPRMVAAGRGPRRPAELRRTGIVVCGLAGLGGLVVAAVPGLVLQVLYGDSYPDAGSLVALLAGVAALSSVVSLATYALLAVRSWAALLPLLGAAVEIVVIGLNHGSAQAVALGSGVAAVLTAGLLAGAVLVDLRSAPEAVGRHALDPDVPRLDPVPAS
jgi:O-antigen/teichoic acid export membrane protein